MDDNNEITVAKIAEMNAAAAKMKQQFKELDYKSQRAIRNMSKASVPGSIRRKQQRERNY